MATLWEHVPENGISREMEYPESSTSIYTSSSSEDKNIDMNEFQAMPERAQELIKLKIT